MRVSGHGDLGFAVMTAPTVRDALDIAIRFAPTRTDAIALRLHVHGDVAALVIDELVPLGSARDVVLFALGVGIWQIGNALTGRGCCGAADFAFDEPAYVARFAAAAPGPIRFGQPQNQILFDAGVLDAPLLLADPAASRLACEHCEEQLRALGRDAQVVARARALVLDHTLPEVAARLHLSTRTLKRRLAEHGASYSDLLAEQRLERALVLLRSDGAVDRPDRRQARLRRRRELHARVPALDRHHAGRVPASAAGGLDFRRSASRAVRRIRLCSPAMLKATSVMVSGALLLTAAGAAAQPADQGAAPSGTAALPDAPGAPASADAPPAQPAPAPVAPASAPAQPAAVGPAPPPPGYYGYPQPPPPPPPPKPRVRDVSLTFSPVHLIFPCSSSPPSCDPWTTSAWR